MASGINWNYMASGRPKGAVQIQIRGSMGSTEIHNEIQVLLLPLFCKVKKMTYVRRGMREL
jgi:hypothetical protein